MIGKKLAVRVECEHCGTNMIMSANKYELAKTTTIEFVTINPLPS